MLTAEGSGRTADQLAAAVHGRPADERAAALVKQGLIQAVPAGDPDRLGSVLSAILTGPG